MTYNYNTGEVNPRSEEEWLNLLLEDGSEYWGDDITEREDTAIRHLFKPFASRLEDLERELKVVQQSLRLETAIGQELDYLGERVGVPRRKARIAQGEVEFKSDTTASKDYLIESGKRLETGGEDPIEFVTTESVILSSGTNSVLCGIEAVNEGSSGNVASGSITTMNEYITGVDSVTNLNEATGGRDREEDPNYRVRIQNTLSGIEVTSLRNLYNKLNEFQYVKEVNPLSNSAQLSDNNLGTHETEVIVDAESGHKDEIAQTIFDNIPMGIDLVSGLNGTATSGIASLPNNQNFLIDFSTPQKISVYIEADVEVESDISKDLIKSKVVDYVGGVKPNGEQVYGDITVGDDVIEGEVEFNIRSVTDVYDTTSLTLGTSSSPTGTSNIAIQNDQRAMLDHTDITINVTQV